MKNLLFFNSKGYPYNFIYDAEADRYNGKLFFPVNSNDTFKTLSFYTFETVRPITYEDTFEFRNIELYNYDGIRFFGETYSGNTITNIQKINESSDFHSKWIFGENFDRKYPIGTIVKFSGPSLTSDFNKDFYTIVDTRPGAVSVLTQTQNDLYTYSYSANTWALDSLNYIAWNDYSGDTATDFLGFNIYSGQTLTIVGSDTNDGLNDVLDIGLTEIFYQNYCSLPTGQTGNELKLEFDVRTERPTVYKGGVTIDNTSYGTGTTAVILFDLGLNSLLNTDKEILELQEGQEIMFEDYTGDLTFASNPIYKVIEVVEYDNILTTAVTFIKEYNDSASRSKSFNNNRSFPMVSTNPTTPPSTMPRKYQTYDYYIELSGLTNEDFFSTGDQFIFSGITSQLNNRTITFNTVKKWKDLRIEYWESRIEGSKVWKDSVVAKAQDRGNTYIEQKSLDAIWMYRTIDLYTIENESLTYTKSDGTTNKNPVPYNLRTTRYELTNYIIEENSQEYMFRLKRPKIDKLICDTTTVESSDFTGDAICYLADTKVEFTQEVLDTYANTIEAFNIKYKTLLNNRYGIDVYSGGTSGDTEITVESLYSYDNSYELYFDNLKLYINDDSGITFTGSTLPRYYIKMQDKLYSQWLPVYSAENAQVYSTQIQFDLSTNNQEYGFRINLNNMESYISFSANTEQTLTDFIDEYQNAFTTKGFNLSSSADTLTIQGQYPNISVWNLEINVNTFSNYEILSEIQSQGIIVTGSEIRTLPPTGSTTFFDKRFSTGMIVAISGDTFFTNNHEYNIIGLSETIMQLSYQGHYTTTRYSFDNSFNNDFNIFSSSEHTIIQSREFLRKPRESYYKDIYYRFRWEEDYDSSMFLYDFSGEQLENYPPVDTTGNTITTRMYTGSKPLFDKNNPNNLYLNWYPNMDINYVNDPSRQQTVFEEVKYLLDQYDSSNANYIPIPLQTFVGFKGENEGVTNNVLLLEKIENIIYSGTTNNDENNNSIQFSLDETGLLRITNPNQPNFSFVKLGFEKDQFVSLRFDDLSTTGETIFENPQEYKIITAGKVEIQLTGITGFTIFNSSGNTNGYKFKIKVEPKTILRCPIYGQTEVEDIRFDIGLHNIGVDIGEELEYIFKESDVKEQGIDYILLNRKRKEMLAVYPEIWNYVGSYKALINAINYFGYNDLELYEYYRTADPTSPMYEKLHKVLIPDIFDNSVEGWNTYDYIRTPKEKEVMKKTNLFNLAYKLTDENGDNVEMYTFDEALYKLNGLKRWLKRNILPLSTNIIDITGVATTNTNLYLNNDVSNQSMAFDVTRTTSVVHFYKTLTQNFGESYLTTLNFYTNDNFIPSGWTCKIKTFSLNDTREIYEVIEEEDWVSSEVQPIGTWYPEMMEEYKNDSIGSLKLAPEQYIKLQKNDLEPYSFVINKDVDPYIYIETNYYNEDGIGMTNNEMYNTKLARNLHLINNNLRISAIASGDSYPYINVGGGYYFFDEKGYLYVDENLDY